VRIESSVTVLSWIPSEAIHGLPRLPFDLGFGAYDDPPPDRIDDLEAMHAAGAFRFANRLTGWIEVDDGRIVGHGQDGRSYLSSTLMRFGRTKVAFQPHGMPDVTPDPVVEDGCVRFRQSAGGRPGVPAPRVVRGRPFAQWLGPPVWTTLELTVHADGRSDGALVGATPFPRHWVYDHEGRLVAKSGLTDFRTWYHRVFGLHTPWGEEDSAAFVTAAETALERQLSTTIMRGGARPEVLHLDEGDVLVEQHAVGTDLFVLLDGVLAVEVDGEQVAEVGPGAVLGERAALEGGRRTATLRATTRCRVARARSGDLDRAAMEQLSEGHRREEDPDQRSAR
jgi:hypothetical protein